MRYESKAERAALGYIGLLGYIGPLVALQDPTIFTYTIYIGGICSYCVTLLVWGGYFSVGSIYTLLPVPLSSVRDVCDFRPISSSEKYLQHVNVIYSVLFALHLRLSRWIQTRLFDLRIFVYTHFHDF